MTTNKAKKTQALSGMKNLGNLNTKTPVLSEEPAAPPPDTKPISGRVNTPCRIPDAARKQLRDLAYYHRPKSGNDFMIEGLDMMFKHYGLKTIAEMEEDSKPS